MLTPGQLYCSDAGVLYVVIKVHHVIRSGDTKCVRHLLETMECFHADERDPATATGLTDKLS
jgi:hypothetical protein